MIGEGEVLADAVAPPTFQAGKAVSGNARLLSKTRLPSPVGYGGEIFGQ